MCKYTDRQKNRAHRRIYDALRRGSQINTPFGKVHARPSLCQLCEEEPVAYGRKDITVAHHLNGYGTVEKDMSVIFVCRGCHADIHFKNLPLDEILERII